METIKLGTTMTATREPISNLTLTMNSISRYHEAVHSDRQMIDKPYQKPKRRRKFESSKIANAAELKKMKIQGGRPAVAKKVTADLDSDDEMIVRMKEARFLEKDIAQALIDQGRTAYNPKTIGTRWRRIKAGLQKRQDDLLDADLTDWHEGDVYPALELLMVS